MLKKAAYGENKSIKVVYRHSLAAVGNWSERLNRIGFDVFQRKITTHTFFVTCFFPLSLIKKQLQMFLRCSKGEPSGHPFNLKTIY